MEGFGCLFWGVIRKRGGGRVILCFVVYFGESFFWREMDRRV